MTQLPTDIKLHKASKTLSLKYASGEEYHLPAEFLRVHSPSAEVQGHGKPILQFGKIGVGLTKVEPAGQYALKLTFDDGHDSGLFTWEYLYQLGVRQEGSLERLSCRAQSRRKNPRPERIHRQADALSQASCSLEGIF